MANQDDHSETFEKISATLESILEGFRVQTNGMSAQEQRLLDVDVRLTRLEDSVSNMTTEVHSVLYMLRGNGTNGIATRIALLEQAKTHGAGRWALFATILAAVMTFIGTVVAAVVSKT